jgi:hypothetical protein
MDELRLSTVLDEFEQHEIVSVEYDWRNPNSYAGGTFVGVTVEQRPDKRLVVFVYDTGKPEFTWFRPDSGNRWIDEGSGAIVTVEPATSSQIAALGRTISMWTMRKYR